MKELMILHSPMVFLKSLQLHLLIKLEFGMQIIDKSYLEYKCLVYNAIAFSLCRMENRLFLDGLMEKLGLFYLNLVNYFMLLMMPIIMVVLQLVQQAMDKELFLEELKVKLEYGK